MILKSLGSVSERASRVLAGVLLAVSLTTAVAVSPADALDKIEPVSVAVVDVQQIMRQSDAAKDIREQVESRRKVYEKDFQQRQTMIEIVAEVAGEVGVGLVLFKNQIFLGDRKIDVTEEIMKRLNKKLPKVKVTFTETQN